MDSNETFDLTFVRRKRAELGITNQQMAEVLDFKNASTYFKYEKGTYHFKAAHLPKLAGALECTINEFFTAKDEG